MWIEAAFKIVLHMSITGSFVILLVLFARALLRKAPKIYSYILWAVVLFRLLCPVAFTSEFSILPRDLVGAEAVEEKVVETEDVVETYTSPIERAESEGVIETYTDPVGYTEIGVAYPTRTYLYISPMQVVSALWLLGILGLGMYSIITLQKLNKKLGAAVHLRENIYVCDYIETPFVIGILIPKIYLPSGLKQAEMTYIIAHEKHHIKRFDHIVKVVAYFALCVHWFNPLVWVAFVLAGKDMEMSCDEAVMAKADMEIRAAYSTSLLRLATGRKGISMAPLAFGEGNAKARIKNLMNYRKPSFWMVTSAVVICIIWGITLCSNPKTEEEFSAAGSILGEVVESAEMLADETIFEAQLRDVTVWQKTVDYDGDGMEDTISFVMQADDFYEEFRGITDGYELLRAPFIGNVKCLSGANGELTFESENISHDRLGNHQISYAEIEGSHYMITTEIGEQMGDGYYKYEVYCLTTQELVDRYEIHFTTAGDDFRARPTASYRQEVVPEFKVRLEKWIADAVLIVATDVNERVENGIFVSSPEMTYEASYYYDLVWERILDEKVRVDNYGWKVNLPEEEGWIRNPQYLLSAYPVAHIKYYDGKAEAPVMLRYGKMEHEDLAYLYDIDFEPDLQTIWYVGEGVDNVEIICQVSKEASEEGKKTVLVSWTYEELNYVIFGELPEGADETSLAKTAMYVVENFPGDVSLKSATEESALTKIAKVEYDMGYQTIACEGQTILGFLDGDEKEDELLYSYVRGGDLGGIYAGAIVPEITINGREYTVKDGLQGIDFALPVTDNVSDYYRLPYGIFDFDEEDEYKEILLVSEDSTGHLLIYAFRYDAGELMFLGNSGRLLDDGSFMVTSEGKLMVMQENGREITYRIEDNRLVREKNVVGSADWRKEWQTID